MNKKLRINPEFILAALAALCQLACLVISIKSTYFAMGGVSAVTAAISVLWLIFAAMLPVFFLTGNKLFLRMSLILGAILRAVSLVNTVIQSIGEAAYALGVAYYAIQTVTLALFILMAISACLKEGKTVSLIMRISACVLLAVNVLMLVQMLGTLGYYHLALKFYIILSYLVDIFFVSAVALYSFKSFAEKKRASYKNAEEELRALKEKRENGEITDIEYTAEKRRILKNI